jgi:uncharacterized repeat protein (TIGR01451 family)
MGCIDVWSLKSVDKATVASGDTVTYTITYGNSGATAESATIVDTLPAGMQYVSASSTSIPAVGQPTVNGQTLTWNVGTIPAQTGPRTIVFQAKVIALTNGQQYLNTVCINGLTDTSTLNINNNNCDDALSVGAANYDLSIDKNPKTRTVAVGDQFDYILTVSNNGQVGVNGFTVKDYLPAGLQFISASA